MSRDEALVVVSSVSKSFSGRPVLTDLSLVFKRGEIVGVVGPSGSGKSVLLKLIGGVIEPDSGTIWLRDARDGGIASEHDNESPLLTEGHVAVGYLFQEGALFDSMTVIENVTFPLSVRGDLKRCNASRAGNSGKKGRRRGRADGLSETEVYRRGYEILNEVGLGQDGLKFPGQLSGGMRRRVALARALVARPGLVLLDDPTAGLDPVAASVIVNLIIKLHRLYRPTVVLVSQDIRRLLPNVERVVALFAGRIVADLPPERLVDEAPPRVVSFLATRYDFTERG